jgi:hypothetical protein
VICEYEFLTEDPKKAGYSILEVDVYGRLPVGMESQALPNHRLSIRKNLSTGRFEAYRHYWGTWGTVRQTVQEDVWYSGTLEKVVEFVNRTYKRIWKEKSTLFEVCRHTEEPAEQGCPYAYDNPKKRWAIELREKIEAEKTKMVGKGFVSFDLLDIENRIRATIVPFDEGYYRQVIPSIDTLNDERTRHEESNRLLQGWADELKRIREKLGEAVTY